jgi:hypothetical protein
MAKRQLNTKPESKFDFLALPAELRNQIYRYIVPIRTKVMPKIRVKGRRDLVLNKLLRLNKAINRETNTLLYAGNQFELSGPKQAVLFLKRIGPANRTMISHIDLLNWNFGTREVRDGQLEWLFGTNCHDKAEAVRQFMTWVATNCPSLTYLSLGQVWIFPTEPCWALQHEPVKKYEHLVRCFPNLSNIEYSRRSQVLVLSAKPMNDELKVFRPPLNCT